MAYKILTQNSIDNTNIDGARAEHFNAGMRNGIVKGAFNEGNFSALSSNVIMLDTCELRISGHRVVIDEAWKHPFSSKPKTPQRYAVVGQVTVGEDTNVTFDLIVQLTDVNLVKNNLFRQTNGAGIYQEEIGRFTLNTDGSVIDVTRTIDIITGSKGEDLDGTINIGVVKTNTLEPELDAEVDVEQRYDAEQKKVLTDFNFSIPRGKGIDNLDVELSEASTNAVQNQAIAKALNNKADKTELETKADLKNEEQTITAGRLEINDGALDNSIEKKNDTGLYIHGEQPSIVVKADETTKAYSGLIQGTTNGMDIYTPMTLSLRANENVSINPDKYINLNSETYVYKPLRVMSDLSVSDNTNITGNLSVSGTIENEGLTNAINNAKTKLEKLAGWVGFTPQNYTLYDGKYFSDYQYIVFVFKNTKNDTWMSDSMPTPVWSDTNRKFLFNRYTEGGERYMEFQFVNNNTFKIVGSSYIEMAEIWGLR